MKKIWYITRSYSPQKHGGAIIRIAQVENLIKLGWKIEVITMNHLDVNNIKNEKNENIHIIGCKFNFLFNLLLEHIGINEDYLDKWGKKVEKYLLSQINEGDILFGTTGGEIQSLKILSNVKNNFPNITTIINYHDPISYTTINGEKINNYPHISRDYLEKKYLKNIDGVVTSSKSMYETLLLKYKFLKGKILNNYFGYISKINIKPSINKKNGLLTVVYGGVFSKLQSPEIILKAALKLPINYQKKIKFVFIGDSSSYKPIKKYFNKKNNLILEKYNLMERDNYLQYLIKNADFGLVPLVSDYLGVCVPSKIYDFINIGIPILGILPNGDANNIINDNGYGISINYNNIDKIKNKLIYLVDNKEALIQFKDNINKNNIKWSIKEKIKDLNKFIIKISDNEK